MTERLRGIVKFFKVGEGYGFIERAGAPDLYVHYTAISEQEGFRSLSQDQTVEFEVGEGAKGPVAKNVIVV